MKIDRQYRINECIECADTNEMSAVIKELLQLGYSIGTSTKNKTILIIGTPEGADS